MKNQLHTNEPASLLFVVAQRRGQGAPWCHEKQSYTSLFLWHNLDWEHQAPASLDSPSLEYCLLRTAILSMMCQAWDPDQRSRSAGWPQCCKAVYEQSATAGHAGLPACQCVRFASTSFAYCSPDNASSNIALTQLCLFAGLYRWRVFSSSSYLYCTG